MARAYIGLSGFSYKEWRGEGLLSPPEMKEAEFMHYYSSRFETVEMDGTWYKFPSEQQVQDWLSKSEPTLHFSFKVHRRVTHFSRMAPEGAQTMIDMVPRLKPVADASRLGPFLIQLPPNLPYNLEKLRAFLELVPVEQARYGIEFRNKTWNRPETEEALRERGVAWVASDMDERKAERRDTADFHYLRLRRTDTDEKILDDWATYIAAQLGKGRDCWVYCKHEDAERPWEWADYLKSKLG